MTQEEKAKAYDEVRKKIAIRFGSNVADEIFSQFEMSEDERIRKSLLEQYKRFKPTDYYDDGITLGDVVSWLEKQGEQKPQRMVSAEVKEAMYDKPAWSEEDEEHLSDAIFFVREYQIPTRDKRLLNAAKEAEDWLKSLRHQKKEALPQWRRLPLNGISYAPDYWCVMDVITSTVGANSASVSALVKGDYYVPLFELEKFLTYSHG